MFAVALSAAVTAGSPPPSPCGEGGIFKERGKRAETRFLSSRSLSLSIIANKVKSERFVSEAHLCSAPIFLRLRFFSFYSNS